MTASMSACATRRPCQARTTYRRLSSSGSGPCIASGALAQTRCTRSQPALSLGTRHCAPQPAPCPLGRLFRLPAAPARTPPRGIAPCPLASALPQRFRERWWRPDGSVCTFTPRLSPWQLPCFLTRPSEFGARSSEFGVRSFYLSVTCMYTELRPYVS